VSAPVLILQHLHLDGPGYLATWLQSVGVPFEVRNAEAGESFPERIDGYRALAILGGTMSANDDLPSLRRAEALVRQAVGQGRPVIGHCLGGQLMARALGAPVHRSPAPELGWLPIRPRPGSEDWFGVGVRPVVMQWHGEAFGLPSGARWLAESDACTHQAFAVGPHLALQFHVEVDAAKLALWSPDAQADPAHPLTVQDRATLEAGTSRHLQAQQALAGRLYERWLAAAG
jgi:GMP synthase (glutamine-hydrolysing)